jgi:hypothetical protein
VTPDEDVEDVPLIRPCESRQVVFVPLVLEVPVILPWASLKVDLYKTRIKSAADRGSKVSHL